LADLVNRTLIRKRLLRENFAFIFKINQLIQAQRQIKNCFITFRARSDDGAGAQIHSILSIMLFAKKFNLQYLHNPLNELAHSKDDAREWPTKWETFFSLGNGETPLDSYVHKKSKLRSIKFIGLLNKRAHTIFQVPNCHSYTDLFSDDYRLMVDNFKAKYYLTPKTSLFQRTDILNIAIHIRRGDVVSAGDRYNRYTPNDVLIDRLNVITKTLDKENKVYQVNIFSEGKVSDFNEFSKYSTTFFLEEDEFKTFHSLVKADILLMAKSSFSYLAALLNEGIIFYEPFWHRPLCNWLNINSDGHTLEKKFKEQLTAYSITK
jgi:hypothetical protein